MAASMEKLESLLKEVCMPPTRNHSHAIRWMIVEARIDETDADLEPDARKCLAEVKTALESEVMNGATAGDRLRTFLSFSLDSRDLDAPITEILDKSALSKEGRLLLGFRLSSQNSEVEARLHRGNLLLSVAVRFPVTVRSDIDLEAATEWLEENNGRFAPNLEPFRFVDDQECRIELIPTS